MAQNRLNLNWKLSLRDERAQFIQDYINSIPFTPTDEELEMMGNYILWGKLNQSDKDGPSRLKNEGLYIPTRANDWVDDNVESLDALIETPGFTETQFLAPGTPSTKKVRQVFSREEARKYAPPDILSSLESLWRQIDQLELIISFYDLQHQRRTAPIRQPLLDRFTQLELQQLQERAQSLKQYNYFKLKHQLIELRQQQYTYQDSYKQTILPQNERAPHLDEEPLQFGTDITVLPFGIHYARPIFNKIFNQTRFPIPSDFSETELNELSSILWSRAPQSQNQQIFDFTNPQHLYQLYNLFSDFIEEEEDSKDSLNQTLHQFLQVARTYQSLTKLEPFQQDILNLKIQKKSNQEISQFIEEKYHHKYQYNYISTLYCKKILPQIAETAAFHKEVCENLFFPENFKKCIDCGETLLLTERNWVRRRRANDGFAPRCKKCEKIRRKGG